HRWDARGAGARAELPDEVEHLPESAVWAIEPVPGGHRVHVRTGPVDGPERTGRAIEARALVLATGAHDRALPFPGWDLPGVCTAGAARAMARDQGIAVGERVIVAGTGPFLLSAAVSLVEAGARVTAIFEAGDPVPGFITRPGGALAGWTKAGELARYAATLARHDVPLCRRSAVIAAFGKDRVEAVLAARLDRDWRPVPHSLRRFEVDAVAVGFGFTPQLELAVAARCDLEDGFVAVNAAQATSVPGVFAAGDLTGVGGADLAAAEGAVAGAAAAKLLGARVRAPIGAMRRVRAGRRFAAALAEAYPLRPGWREWLREDTPVCRCEEVAYGAFRRAVEELDVGDARVLELATGAGLGLCQGRICGRSVAELAGLPETADAFARRPIAAPVRLGELAEDVPVDEGP
ncbi:NAD(P)/FAD-dependent oxidoreductase, partial [Glycomyces tenuis]